MTAAAAATRAARDELERDAEAGIETLRAWVAARRERGAGLIGSVACPFTRPSFRIFCNLVAGWILTPRGRTVTCIILCHRRERAAYP